MGVNQPPAASRTTSILLWGVLLSGAALLGGAVTALLIGGNGVAAARAPVEAPATTGAEPAAAELQPPVSPETLAVALGHVDAPQRARLLEDAALFRAFVEQEIARRGLLAAARQAGVAEDPRFAWLAGRAADQVLVNAFVAGRISAALGPDFPDEERIEAFFEANRERYAQPERVTVSQIFLRAPAGGGEAGRAAVLDSAKTIVQEIRSGATSFEISATRRSDHEPSRANGGLMGLVRVADLRPELREAVLALAPGEVSEPLVGSDGVHIVRRGPTVAARIPDLDAVRERVVADLRRASEAELRRRLAASALEAAAERPDQGTIEGWRELLISSISDKISFLK